MSFTVCAIGATTIAAEGFPVPAVLAQPFRGFMVFYDIEDVREGMVLGEAIYDPRGVLMVSAGFEIRQTHIEQLKKRHYRSILVRIEGTDEVVPDALISDAQQREVCASVDKLAHGIGGIFGSRLRGESRIADILKNEKQTIDQVIHLCSVAAPAGRIVQQISAEPWKVLHLAKPLRGTEEAMAHASHVAILSVALGRRFGLNPDEMRQLAIGALLYDLGMLTLPRELLGKRLDDFQADERALFEQHTAYGYMMLAGKPTIPPTSSIVALAHHERQDGNGYPLKVRGENLPPAKSLAKGGMIHRFAEIVAVADTWDRLVWGRRPFNEALPPAAVTRKLLEMAGSELNIEVVRMLLSIVPLFPVGSRVRLTECPVPDLVGATGVVARIVPEAVSSPVIILYENPRGERIPALTIDLSIRKGFSLELA